MSLLIFYQSFSSLHTYFYLPFCLPSACLDKLYLSLSRCLYPQSFPPSCLSVFLSVFRLSIFLFAILRQSFYLFYASPSLHLHHVFSVFLSVVFFIFPLSISYPPFPTIIFSVPLPSFSAFLFFCNFWFSVSDFSVLRQIPNYISCLCPLPVFFLCFFKLSFYFFVFILRFFTCPRPRRVPSNISLSRFLTVLIGQS